MPPSAQEMGPGTFSVGSVGSVMNMTAQLTKCRVAWKANAADSVKTLSGDSVGGGTTYTAQVTGTAFQDTLAADGMVDWTWANKGEEHPFTFIPRDGSRGVSGVVRVDPLDVGGDVGAKNTSDFTWDCVGEPELVDDLT
jgi:hypothetical protein